MIFDNIHRAVRLFSLSYFLQRILTPRGGTTSVPAGGMSPAFSLVLPPALDSRETSSLILVDSLDFCTEIYEKETCNASVLIRYHSLVNDKNETKRMIWKKKKKRRFRKDFKDSLKQLGNSLFRMEKKFYNTYENYSAVKYLAYLLLKC